MFCFTCLIAFCLTLVDISSTMTTKIVSLFASLPLRFVLLGYYSNLSDSPQIFQNVAQRFFWHPLQQIKKVFRTVPFQQPTHTLFCNLFKAHGFHGPFCFAFTFRLTPRIAYSWQYSESNVAVLFWKPTCLTHAYMVPGYMTYALAYDWFLKTQVRLPLPQIPKPRYALAASFFAK